MRKQGRDVEAARTTRTDSKTRIGRNWGIWLLLFVGILLAAQMQAVGQTVLPGLRAPLLDTPATPSAFRSGMSGTSSGGLDATDAEIVELARSLKYDPGLMYKFVHDHIRFTPMWGQVKGPYMTWMDRSGNAFDQASLMIALLEEAAEHGTEYTITNPKFVVGEIRLSAAEAMSWLSIPNDVTVAEKVLARSGLYGTVLDAGDGTIDRVNLEHVWVKVTIDSTTYRFDPSFKSHTSVIPPQELLQVNVAMGYYQESAFLTRADEYMAYGTGYIENVNAGNIAEDMKTYSARLIESIKSYAGGADLKGVIGGTSIEPVEESALPPSSPPYVVVSEDDEFGFAGIPDMYRTTLRIQHAGIDRTFFSSDIYGRRLTLQYNGSNQPQLVLDGTVKATGNSTTPGQAYNLTFTVNHPYNGTSFNEATTITVVSGGFYHIVNGWADTGTAILKKHRDLLEELRYDGHSDSSEQVLGESYALIGLTWLAQVSRMRSMTAEITRSTVVNHHLVGVTGQTESGGAPYFDIPLGSLGITAKTTLFRGDQGVFLAVAGHANAYEHQVIRQFQDCNAVSTVKLFEMANAEATYGKIYTATSATWSSIVEPALHNYSQAVKDQVVGYVNAGFTVHLPEKGDLSVDDWTGNGFQALLLDANCLAVAYRIGGVAGGGAAASDDPLSPEGVFKNCYGAETGRGGDGAYGFGNTDLSIGGGGYPFGLSFGRQYSSRRRFEDGPLGLGWTHSLDMRALVRTDSLQFLGTSSPVDAAAHIVSLFVTSGVLDSSVWSFTSTTASLCQSWVMDQMVDEVVVIKQGSGTTTFVRDPNGTYNPPPGASLKLVVQQDGTFRLKNSSGVFNDFDGEGRISQWSDAHGNEVNFTYTGGKLTQVANKIGGTVVRSIGLSYTGDRIASVSDSAGRSVAYTYDQIGQLTTFTSIDGNDVTYGYVSGKDGLMEKIYSPIDPNLENPVLTVVYDSLDRMKQQIDANDCAWDYYLATYRTEVVEPAQLDPNDVLKRFSTIRWANPETKKVITKDQMGRETTRAYDGQLRTTSVLAATGMSTQLDYDANHNVTGVKSVAIPGSDVNDITVSSDYHDVEDPVTGRWFVKVEKTTNIVGLETRYEYDFDPNYPSDPNVGNLMRIVYPDVQTPNGTESRIVQLSYYSDGRIHTQTDPNGMVTSYEYYTPAQGAGLKKVVVDDNGLELTTEYTYDNVGRVVSATDPRGNTAQTEYFDSGLVRKTIAPSPFNYETVYEYYADGKLKHVKQVLPGGAGGGGGGSGNDFSSDPNCAALWRFENGALTADSIGSNTLTQSGSPAADTSNYREGSASANLASGRFYITDASLSADYPFKSTDTNKKISVCLWFNMTSGSTQAVGAGLYGKNTGYGTDGLLIGVYEPSGDGSGRICVSIGNYKYYLPSSETIYRNRWYHIGVTYQEDGANGAVTVRVYDASAQSVASYNLSTRQSTMSSYNLQIGYHKYSSRNFYGLFDELVVFNDVLTASEIDQIRQGTYGASGGGGSGEVEYLQSITYNNRGQKATVRGPYPENATASELQVNYTQYSYDALGRPWKVTDAEGNVTETRYYPDGRVWKVIDAEGNDAITKTYNDDGSLRKVADAKGNETHYEYNGAMKLKKTTFEDDTFEMLDYDWFRRLTTKTTRSGQEIEISYDDWGRVEAKDVDDPGNPVNPSNTISYAYDRLGRVVQITDDTGTIAYTYDHVGRLARVVYPGNKSVGYQYDASGNRTRLTYPDASYITYQYDALNRLTAVRNAADVALAEYSYDARSRRTGLDYANGAGIDYTYDVASRLLDVNNVTDTGQLKYAYSYDDVGNRMSMSVTDSSGTKIHVYDYDNIYQVTDVDYPEDFDYLATDTTFEYDEVGNRTSVVDDAGTVNYTPNALNQYTQVGGVEYAYDDNGNMTYDGRYEYAYDAENRLVRVRNIDSLAAATDCDLSFTTGGDAQWFAQNAEYSYDFDAAQSGPIGHNQITWMETTVDGPGTITFDYKLSAAAGDTFTFWVDGQVVFSRSGSMDWSECGPLSVSGLGRHTLRWQYTKDGSGSAGSDCAWVDHVRWQPQTLYNSTQLQEGLDTDLNVYTIGTVWNMCDWPLYHIYYGDSSTRSGSISANQKSQMEVRLEGPGTVTFYWKVSSLENYHWLEVYLDGVRQDRISGEVGWQQKSYTVSGAGTHSLMWQYSRDGWDPAGSDRGWVDYLQWTPGAGGASTTDWDQITYTYDPLGRRIRKDVDGVVTKYLYDGDHCIAEYDGDDTLLRKFVHGPSIDEPICMIEAAGSYAGTYYYHYDTLGSVVALSDADGETVQVYEYDVYGQPGAADPGHPNPFAFTGRRFDPETGLYYYRARYYNPTIGRFLQTDPIGYADGMNWYAYCHNNSVNHTDPYGREASGIYGHVWDGEYMWELSGNWNLAGVAYTWGVDLPGVVGVADVPGLLYIDRSAGSYPYNGIQLIGDRRKLDITVDEFTANSGSATAPLEESGDPEAGGATGSLVAGGGPMGPMPWPTPLPPDKEQLWEKVVEDGLGDIPGVKPDEPKGLWGKLIAALAHGARKRALMPPIVVIPEFLLPGYVPSQPEDPARQEI
ncbi:RHS repeat-associated core domain-containing protein [Anaerobaca lacustris]|uniref:RHS repeat-associated core domain-containing protein n=1 Tax=Anaerobaca lacustris TaxID=3044600 RepID=A0AAW6U1K6_9BACT|nr:RHS repeat-associated core domain-containing protein [Sedimentisphaerales bacterium M17dextr]